jgi:ATP-dependent Clp endopeptidase proteolytic subunit ClpP
MKRSSIHFGCPTTRQSNWLSESNDITKPINKKTKRTEPPSPKEKKSKKSKVDNSNDSDDSNDSGDENPFKFPNLFKEENERIYLKQNHLYFHNGVNEKSVDNVKKLMREYLSKYLKSKNSSSLSTTTPKPLFLHIYSPGGGVYAGLSLYDFITEYNKTIPVYTVVEGLAASAATIISIAGIKRFITPNSYMLIHQLSTYFGGNFEQIKDEFGNCERIMKQLKEIYASKTNLTRKQLNEVLKRDVTWSAEDCKKYGLVDEIKLIDIFNDKDV